MLLAAARWQDSMFLGQKSWIFWKYGVKSRKPEIKPAENICLYLEILLGDLYLDFLHARIIHDGTSIKSFGESYLVQFSVNYKTPFFDVSAR